MELGEKIRQARLEAGLSQRQLCGEEITRNMLSLIENGSAKPSMRTLRYLADRLGKTVSFFLEETAVLSPNSQILSDARSFFDEGRFAEAAAALQDYREPDPVYDREKALLWALSYLALAEEAIHDHREIYAQQLLAKADIPLPYCSEDLQRRRLLLLGRIRNHPVSNQLPSLDEELLLRAREALTEGQLLRSARLLDAVDAPSPQWHLLRGQVYLKECAYAQAAKCLHAAEGTYPQEVYPMLEQCYRELEDYKQAYEYACKQK